MSEEKIHHTDALSLCSRITRVQSAISSLQHELVLHYSATGVPSRKTKGAIHRLESSIDDMEDELDVIKHQLEEMER